ncbi:MAG: retropepsin-like aspartic protease [Rikenellaceae bacterium]|nr:retropepsin-like aspartic protease [Rikenellaceae bacterium]
MRTKENKRGLFFVLCIYLIAGHSSILSGQKTESKLPYEMYGGKMIVNVIINGNEERVIFDTGAQISAFSKEFCSLNSLPLSDSVKVVDSNNQSHYYRKTQIESLITPDQKIKFKNLIPIVMEETSMIKCFDVCGIIGSDLISGLICIIDSQTKTITLATSETQYQESYRFSHQFQEKSYMPVFELYVNNNYIKTLFDTGSDGFVALKNEDYRMLDQNSAIDNKEIGYGFSSIGLSGVALQSNILRTKIKDLRIGVAKFRDITVETENLPYTLMGTKVLEYGKVVIDYPRRIFYFIPYTNEAVVIPSKSREFYLTVSEGVLKVSTVWGDMSNVISPGDRVTHINGEPVKDYDFCESITIGIAELKGDDIKKLLIETKSGKIIELDYK